MRLAGRHDKFCQQARHLRDGPIRVLKTEPLERGGVDGKPPMVIVALDLGSRRIGVAATDALGLAVHPVAVVLRRSPAEDIAALGELIVERRAKLVVAGLPLNLNGSEGRAARAARRFAARLSAALDLPVKMHDERLTTFEAKERLKDTPGGPARRRSKVDCMAAAIILESWLASCAQG